MTDPDQPTELARFADVHQAEFVISVLDGSDVEAFIDQQFAGSIAPHYMINAGGIRVFVRASELERAKEILATLSEASTSEE